MDSTKKDSIFIPVMYCKCGMIMFEIRKGRNWLCFLCGEHYIKEEEENETHSGENG